MKTIKLEMCVTEAQRVLRYLKKTQGTSGLGVDLIVSASRLRSDLQEKLEEIGYE